MCLDNIEEIAAAVEAAKRAKDAWDAFHADVAGRDLSSIAGTYPVELTVIECDLIHARRVEAAESRLRDLGFRGPVGDAQRTIASNRTGSDR